MDMKKIMVITAMLLLVASSAFAGTTITMASTLTKAATGKTLYGASTGAASASTSLIGKNSTGVGVGVFCNASGTGYSLITQHLNGTKAYGSSYDSTAIFSVNVNTVGTALKAVPTAITTADFSSWKAL
jgi:hypothetical protein